MRVLQLPRHIVRMSSERFASYSSLLSKNLLIFSTIGAMCAGRTVLGDWSTIEQIVGTGAIGLSAGYLLHSWSVYSRIVRVVQYVPKDKSVHITFMVGKRFRKPLQVPVEDFVMAIPGDLNLAAEKNMFQSIEIKSKVLKNPRVLLVDVKGDRYKCLELIRFGKRMARKLIQEKHQIVKKK